MNVYFTKVFKKHYQKRIHHNKKLKQRFEERYAIFVINPRDPTLNDHMLTGKMKGFQSFSVTGDVRVVYYIFEDIVYFVDIGTHNQVYKGT